MKKYVLIMACLALALCVSPACATEGNGITARGYAAMQAGGPLMPYEFQLRAVGEHDVLVDVLYSGICHSDIHLIDDAFGMTEYPYVTGHEIVGKVSAAGKRVTRYKVGDVVGIGSMLDSCGECEFCLADLEQFCTKGAVWTGGGYATRIVVNERFALAIPDGMPLERIAPQMCAGITVYSPLKKLNIKKRDKIAVAGLGGLGHMALQYAVSMGAEVTVFEITDAKAEAARKLGAADYVNTRKDSEALGHYRNRFKGIINTIPVRYDLQPYIDALRDTGTLVIVGMPPSDQSAMTFDVNTLPMGGKIIMGSSIGGIRETQEMLDYAAEHKIYPLVEVISADRVNEAFKRVKAGEVNFRFVIDVSSIK